MIDKFLKTYRYVKEYDTTKPINKKRMLDILERAWKITPSKNNFMPYRVTVLGPTQENLKSKLYNLCLAQEQALDSIQSLDEFFEERYTKTNTLPQFHNLKSAPYVIIFTQRIADKFNPWQQQSIAKGRKFEQTNSKNPKSFFKTSAIEVGMFAGYFASICLSEGIDISHTLCFPTAADKWRTSGLIDDKDPSVMLIMTAGKDLVYRQDTAKGIELEDTKPAFEDIVKFIK